MNALVIEDNPKMAESICACLREADFKTEICRCGPTGEELAATGPYELIVLDVMLAGCSDGLELCRRLRRRKIATPIIMVSALGSVEDRINGLDVGADDYVVKPFKFTELAARARAVVRRTRSPEQHTIRFDDLELDLHTRRLSRGDSANDLCDREFSLMQFFLNHPNRALSRELIGEGVWGIANDCSSNIVDVYVSALRRKIQRDGLRTLLHTVKNVGYRFGIME